MFVAAQTKNAPGGILEPRNQTSVSLEKAVGPAPSNAGYRY
jgi:hypothetical protein